MKRKALCFILTLLAIAVFSLGCGGGGGHSNPAASNLSGNAKVSGVVVDSSNNPVANANVKLVLSSTTPIKSLVDNTNKTLRLATNGDNTEFDTTTNNKGQYTFVNVPFGEYTLSALTADKAQIVTKLAVRSNVVVQPDLTLMPFGTITGTVSGGNTNAIVYIENTSFCSATDGSGNYAINYVPASSTPYVLKVISSGYELKKSVKVTASIDKATTDSNKNLSWKADNLTLTPILSVYTLTCTISGDSINKSSTNLLAFAVNRKNGTTYAAKVENLTCDLCIAELGTYDVFAVCINGGANITSESKAVKVQTLGTSGKVALSIGKQSSDSSYASISGTVIIRDTTADSDKTVFTLALYNDKTGAEYKKTLSNGSDFTFSNLTADSYSLVVYSDKLLRIQRGITLQKGEAKNLNEFSPCDLGLDSILTLNIDGTVTCNISNPVDGGSASDLPVSYSVCAVDSDNKLIALNQSDNSSKTEFDVNTSANSVTLSTDKISGSDKISVIKFFFKDTDGKQTIFENSFKLSSDKALMTNKTISLKKNSSTNLTLNDDIILFKAINYNRVTYYLVVTSKDTYVFDSSTGEIAKLNGKTGSFNYTEKIGPKISTTSTIPISVTNGNACYIPDTTNPSLAIQYNIQDPNCSGNKRLFITTSYSVENVFGGGSSDPYSNYYYDEVNLSVYPQYKLVGKRQGSSIKFYSAVGDKVFCYENNNSSSVTNTTISSDISYSTVLFENDTDTRPVIYYLSKDDSDITYFGKSIYVDDYNLNYKFNTSLGSTDNYTLSDCLDNVETENKVFIWKDYNKNTQNINPQFVYSDTIYSGSNIKSSYINPNKDTSLTSTFPFDAWIERNSDGQNLVLRNLRNYKEQKLEIKQVLNSSSFLEGSIGYTTNNGNKIHVICADDSGNIQVKVFNCIDSNN